ncbi:G-type lectin S-receptor-like serine/threonine-protein kinase B120 [Chenopodium quinoa]|uniref:G-type lectin S-receptor-like serine/threonine-protein kinase B120 n=1 Tax=Chenopodium quinoa TaxID=63459 RepID=UPI000B777EE0|nr:G-type lectin S-receptor-like serine/threonine-protein kinase B120 [Chenopodium quinoa]
MDNLCLCKKLVPISYFFIKIISLILLFAFCSNASNTIAQGQVLKDGETLKSEDGSFEFGFYSPSNSSLRYVGIWYSNISVDFAVWVANRNNPISNKNGSVTLSNDGVLAAFDGFGTVVWSTNTTAISKNYTGILHNDGNLEIRGSYNYPVPSFSCWESFDHPTDTYLPGMRVPVNPNVGENRIFTSWRSVNDPSSGNFSMGVDPRAAPQFVIWEGSNRRWRSGYWNGLSFTGVPNMAAFYYYGFKLSNADADGIVYFTYLPLDRSSKFKFRVSWDGYEESMTWADGGKEWNMMQKEPGSECDVFNKCGVNGYCRNATGDFVCGCFQGFAPKFPDQWSNGSWSGGCVRENQLKCEIKNDSVIAEDVFLEVDNVKLPDFANLLGAEDEGGCGKECLQNCSCRAYAYVGGIGCMVWSGDLSDIQQFKGGGSKLHIRVASSALGNKGKLSGPKIAAIVVSGVILFGIILLCLCKFRDQLKAKRGNDALTIGLRKGQVSSTDISGSQEMIRKENLANAKDLPLINYNLVASATNFFSAENKLGEGGFGPVYKGTLPGGQEIAVKKLSRKSGQGMAEFMNEIMLIAKLQHRNLVRILGCCVHGDEKMLIYEYMPNKSLDGLIFEPMKKQQLDWKKRFTIIEGIARGLLYLHRDARCTIIHRDLKASNILLDQEMSPKISDFGMARIFGGNQDEENTNRIVGTYGYMSPEYAMEGFFSERSDVYSFGVLLLEVVTGHRSTRFRFSEHTNLIEYAWKLWSEGRTMELVDSSFASSCPSNEVIRCVHIALLCVQDSAVHRPTMSQVVLLLETDSLALSNPREPTLAYSSNCRFVDIDIQKGYQDIESSNHVTVTMLVGR